MKKIILLFLFISTLTFAQDELRFEFDYAQFKYDSTSNYLEIYYSIVPSDFILSLEEDGYKIKGKMHIQIQKTETQELVVNKEWGLVQPLKDSIDHKNSDVLLGLVRFNVKHGNYTIDISIEDMLDEGKIKNYSEELIVNSFSKDIFSVSDIELATRIINESPNNNSIFYKNTLEVFPNPSIVFTQNTPVVFYYSELYNLNQTKSDKLILTKSLYSNENIKVYETSRELNTSNESIVEVGFINLKKYPTDTYTLVLSVSNESKTEYAASRKRFYLVNPDVEALAVATTSDLGYMSSEFGVFSEEECDDLFSKSKIIAKSDEIDQYEDLDSLSQKRKFLFQFWQRRDEDPSTPYNEFKTIYLTRVKNANTRFRTMTSEGYKTDRGRIFVRLGEPDEIERHPNEINSKPYEVWYYNQIEGGVHFIFGDFTGFNFYELLHSTMRGELQDPDWARRLTTK